MGYLEILTFILLEFSLLKHKYGVLLFKSMKEAPIFVVSCLLIGVLWDSFGILRSRLSLEEYLVGITIGLLPLENIYFITIVPFSVVVLYKIVTRSALVKK